jgi:hypothetical protein
VVRSIQVIVWAILQTQPQMSTATARGYAKVVQAEAKDHHFDPFTMVSMAHYESRWRAGVGNGRCFGLVGVCATNYPVCQSDPQSAACDAKKAELVVGSTNLRISAGIITANRKFCRRKTGSAKFHHWLASYQGLNSPSKGIWCGQRKVRGRWRDVPKHRITTRVMARRRWLMRNMPR